MNVHAMRNHLRRASPGHCGLRRFPSETACSRPLAYALSCMGFTGHRGLSDQWVSGTDEYVPKRSRASDRRPAHMGGAPAAAADCRLHRA